MKRNKILTRVATGFIAASMTFNIVQSTAFAQGVGFCKNDDSREEYIKTVKVALLDSGLSSRFECADSISFVMDDRYNSHADLMAETLLQQTSGVELYDAKVLDYEGAGKYSDVSKGVEWAVEKGCEVIVMSFAGYEASAILKDAIEYAEENDVVVVAAAGNDSWENAVYPAAYPTVLSAGMLNEEWEIDHRSNYGYVDRYVRADNGTSYAAQILAAEVVKQLQSNDGMTAKKIREELSAGKPELIEAEPIYFDGTVYEAACTTHSYVLVTSGAATCTQNGYKVYRCSKAGCTASKNVTVYATGHKEQVTIKEATCQAPKCKVTSCSVCKAVLKKEQLSTSLGAHVKKVYYTAATCTAPRFKITECSLCKSFISCDYVSAPLGHVTKTTITAATCTEPGYTTTQCTRSNCKALLKKTQTSYPKGHSGSVQSTSATCTKAAETIVKCSNCDKVLSRTTKSPALGHKLITTNISSPSCEASGSARKVCERSGCDYKTTVTLPKISHTYITEVEQKGDSIIKTMECSLCKDVCTNEYSYSIEDDDREGFEFYASGDYNPNGEEYTCRTPELINGKETGEDGNTIIYLRLKVTAEHSWTVTSENDIALFYDEDSMSAGGKKQFSGKAGTTNLLIRLSEFAIDNDDREDKYDYFIPSDEEKERRFDIIFSMANTTIKRYEIVQNRYKINDINQEYYLGENGENIKAITEYFIDDSQQVAVNKALSGDICTNGVKIYKATSSEYPDHYLAVSTYNLTQECRRVDYMAYKFIMTPTQFLIEVIMVEGMSISSSCDDGVLSVGSHNLLTFENHNDYYRYMEDLRYNVGEKGVGSIIDLAENILDTIDAIVEYIDDESGDILVVVVEMILEKCGVDVVDTICSILVDEGYISESAGKSLEALFSVKDAVKSAKEIAEIIDKCRKIDVLTTVKIIIAGLKTIVTSLNILSGATVYEDGDGNLVIKDAIVFNESGHYIKVTMKREERYTLATLILNDKANNEYEIN